VQWLTAGRGILHAEMFPLLDPERPNPLELFQIWLNLPRADKMVAPHFSMLWSPRIPQHHAHDDEGRLTTVTLHAGSLGALAPPPPPPSSWAARPESDLAIWTLALAPRARFVLPAAQPGTVRTLYHFRGSGMQIGGRNVPARHQVELHGDRAVSLDNGAAPAELLLLQGRPIAEPIARHGPFVMNTEAEIEQAYADYRRTRFGGWPWDRDDPVHGPEAERFARHADGRSERPS
jgi:quercetin 2,3-dioxygenase